MDRKVVQALSLSLSFSFIIQLANYQPTYLFIDPSIYLSIY